MKTKVKVLGLATVLMLGLGGLAHATNYDCDGGANPVPSSVAGDVLIVVSTGGGCTISHDVTATGFISIGGALDANVQNLMAGTTIGINMSGSITTGTLTATGGGVVLVTGPYDGSTVTVNGDINGNGIISVDTLLGDITISGNINGTASSGELDVTAATTGTAGVIGSVYVGGNITAKNYNILLYSTSTIETGAINGGTDGTSGGEITITPQGTLTVNGDIDANGDLTVSVPADVTVTGAINGAASTGTISVTTTANTGSIDIAGGITAPDYDVVLNSQSTVVTGTINVSSATGGNTIRIFTDEGGGSDLLTIGTGGIAGLNASNSGSSNTQIGIQNAGSGGMQVNGSVVNVSSSAGPAGGIFLDAGTGTITVTGTLSADGSSGQSAGQIILNAGIVTANGATITASDDGTAGQVHYVTLSAGTINYTSGFTVSANGSSNYAGVYLAPAGSQPLTIPTDPTSPIVVGSISFANTGLSISGDSSALNVNATGPENTVQIAGYPLVFSGGPVNITASQSDVYLSYVGDLQFNGGNVVIDTSTTVSGAAAGSINIYATSMSTTPAGNVALKANGGGNGGNITVFPGTGNISMGTNAGDYAVSSNGGSFGGNGGTIDINPASGNITIDTADAITAVASGVGNGGTIELIANPNLTAAAGLSGVLVNADAEGTGNGGSIQLLGNGDLDLGAGTISADSLEVGNGGSVEIGYLNSLTTETDSEITVNAGSSGDGTGGTINIHDIAAGVTLNSTINASGQGTGNGGNISVDASGDLALGASAVTLDGGNTGTGGEVSLTSDSGDITGTVAINAYGGCSDGNGGTVTLSGDNISFVSIGASSGGDPSTSSCMAIAAKPVKGKQAAPSKKN